jgi:hypothetical protein
MIDDDIFMKTISDFLALLDEPRGESKRIEARTKEKRRNSFSNASHERCHQIETNREGKRRLILLHNQQIYFNNFLFRFQQSSSNR